MELAARKHWPLIAGVATYWLTLALLIALVFGAGLPTVTAIGSEHTLHGLLTIWLAFASASVLASAWKPHGRQLAVIGMLSALVVAVRYEGALTVGVIAVLFIATRRL